MTTDALTEEAFARHVNTTFSVPLDESRRVELKLVEVVGYESGHNEQQGMERFSLFFVGPVEPFLAQGTYTMGHEGMGSNAIFIVPIAKTDEGIRYQAVFNYFRR